MSKEDLAIKPTYNVADKPGQAIYICVFCYWMVFLEDDAKLPVCGNCNKGEKTKYIKTELVL